jgi:tripartite motif-containing protein 71
MSGVRVSLGVLVAAVVLWAAPAASAACSDPCPYSGVTSIGSRDGGVLRLPQAVAIDGSGRLYVGDQYTHAIQRFGPDGSFQLAFGSPGSSDGKFGAIVGVAIDPADGSVYVADAENDRIQHFTADGTWIASFGESGSGFKQFQFAPGNHVEDPAQGGLAIGDGYLWVADAQNDRVQRYPLSDVSDGSPVLDNYVIIGAGPPGDPGNVDNPQGVWASDYLYVADDLHNVIKMYSLGGIYQKTIGLGGPGKAPGQFDGAWDVAVDAAGHIFAVDDNNSRIQVFDGPSGALIGGWGGFGRNNGQLEFPRAITIGGPDGTLYVANTADGRVDKFTTGGVFLQSFGQDGRGPGQFLSPTYISASPDGGLGVPDTEDNRIEQLAPDNSVIAAYGLPRAPTGPATPQTLTHPMGIAFDGSFNALTADTDNNRLVRRTLYGDQILNVFGNLGALPGQYNGPFGVAIDSGGSTYVADQRNDRVQKVDGSGNSQTTYGPDIGGETLDGPRGVAISPANGHLYVSSGVTNKIFEVDPASGAKVNSFGGSSATADPGKFSTPGGVAVDAAGRVYVVDIGNDRVQRFTAGGVFEAKWGSEGTANGEFEHPTGIAAACDGTISVSDEDNNRLQRFTLPDPKTSTCLATPAKPVPPPPPPPVTPIPVPQPPIVVKPPPTPQLLLSIKSVRLTKAFTRRELRLSALCDRGCTLKLTATLAPKYGKKRPKRALRAITVKLPKGSRRTIVLKLSTTDIKQLRRVLGRHKAIRLVISAKATQTGTKSASVMRALSASG